MARSFLAPLTSFFRVFPLHLYDAYFLVININYENHWRYALFNVCYKSARLSHFLKSCSVLNLVYRLETSDNQGEFVGDFKS